ncbi:hypothetical protein EIN_311970 [Entamoeba invadens IP1]|uniref:Uncharacterized protein n=1 Tax=Entamoeba invadens IP1 TaxID=370355 RepID=A0A0A1TUU4_ENTIV|nr:hypothetical protein EIN_311970 [Entamoeba invadens IP1]ELP83926.1 hypothetical protein EIN_311970 [Entamoeba invadens IP1]|eukprot:XP_004183272.1 hypothetical protein EIN_311970 [Entamoeba invadens IP1]
MKSTQLIAVDALFHLCLVPSLLSIFGSPTSGERYVKIPTYGPLITYVLFGLTNIVVHPFLVFLAFEKTKPKKYSIFEYIISTLLSALITFVAIFLLRSQMTHSILHLLLCSLGIGAYAAPLVLVAIKNSIDQKDEKHFLVFPALFTLVVFFLSALPGSLDHYSPLKFFPTPLFYAFVPATFLSDIYTYIYYLYVETTRSNNLDK